MHALNVDGMSLIRGTRAGTASLKERDNLGSSSSWLVFTIPPDILKYFLTKSLSSENSSTVCCYFSILTLVSLLRSPTFSTPQADRKEILEENDVVAELLSHLPYKDIGVRLFLVELLTQRQCSSAGSTASQRRQSSQVQEVRHSQQHSLKCRSGFCCFWWRRWLRRCFLSFKRRLHHLEKRHLTS